MRNLLFIKNLEELNYIKKNLPQLLRTHKIIAVCSLPWLELEGEGFSVEMASSYLPEDELKGILGEARVFSKAWYKPFERSLDYRGINLGELVRLDLIWFFRELLASQSVIRRIIDTHRPKRVVFFTDLDFPNLSALRYNGSSDIFAATLIWACKKGGIPVDKLRFKWKFKRKLNIFRLRLKRKISKHIPIILFFLRYLKRLGKNIVYCRGHNRMPLGSFSRDGQKKLAVALGSSFELLVLKDVIKTLSDAGKFNLALVNLEPVFKMPRQDNRCGLDGKNGLRFISLDDFNLSIAPEKAQVFSLLKNARKHLDNDSLLNNPNLSVQFDFLWSDYFYEAVSMIDKVYCLYRKFNPDMVIVANAIGYTQRILVKLAKNLGVKSVTVPHGWVGDIDEYDFETDLFLAWGELSRQQLAEEFNKSSKDIAAAGALQFESFIPSFRNGRQTDMKEIKEKVGLRQDARVVLILTGGIAQSVFCATDMRRFLEFWEFMKSFIAGHPEIDFILRPHPTEELAGWYRKLAGSFKRANFRISEEEKLDAFLPAVDVGISIGIPSTANYLCLLFGIPIIIFRGFDRTALLRTDEAWNEESGLLVTKKEEELAGFILQLLNDNDFKGGVLTKELGFLDKSLSVRDGKAAERTLGEIEKLFN